MLTEQEKKRLIIQSQFGKYLPLVKAIPYAEIATHQLKLHFDHRQISEEVAFHMVANGYLDYFDNEAMMENVIRKGNKHRQNNDTQVEIEDEFLEQVWDKYQQIKLAAWQQNQPDHQMIDFAKIQQFGSTEAMWDRMLINQLPELAFKRQRLLENLDA